MATLEQRLKLLEQRLMKSRSVDCFEDLVMIGKGSYGEVYRAREIQTGNIVALKKIKMKKDNTWLSKAYIREIEILEKLDHDNVIKLKEIVTSSGPEKDEQGKPDGNMYSGSIYMVLEYMEHDLTGLSRRLEMGFTVPQIKCYMKQLLTGLAYCHFNRILHRDIKGDNLLVNNEGNLKLADFGLARSFSDGKMNNCAITLWYRPPELLLGVTKYGPAVDMWSVGCVFAELLDRKPIFPGNDKQDQLTKIFELCGSPDEDNWPGVSKILESSSLKAPGPTKRRVKEVFKDVDFHALELLEKMLALDPSQRISAKNALDAKYFCSEPLPCDPKSLPIYESSHELPMYKKRKQQSEQDENAKQMKLPNPDPHASQQTGQPDLQIRPGPSQPIHKAQPSIASGSGHHYGKPPGPLAGPTRFHQGWDPIGGYNLIVDVGLVRLQRSLIFSALMLPSFLWWRWNAWHQWPKRRGCQGSRFWVSAKLPPSSPYGAAGAGGGPNCYGQEPQSTTVWWPAVAGTASRCYAVICLVGRLVFFKNSLKSFARPLTTTIDRKACEQITVGIPVF